VANEEHLARIKNDVNAWNEWRRVRERDLPFRLDEVDVSGADLSGVDLSGADLRDGNLRDADLNGADLRRADLTGADLSYAELHDANLRGADLSGVYLSDANLRAANLSEANLHHANLYDADLQNADLSAANLRDANLRGADLRQANLRDADLSGAHLRGANLSEADLREVNLIGVNLSATKLIGANLYSADLRDANLNKASLNRANLNGADLTGANLTEAWLSETVFADSNLTNVVGLETCSYFGSSVIDHRTLQKSRSLPIQFLRGVGLPERLIEYLPALLDDAIRIYSCFISYSTKDQEFADRIHADLQNRGVRCWFAPHDMPIGGKILDEIDTAIQHRDKLLLILSEHSIKSDWVEDEVTRAFEEERKRSKIVLFPIRIDDSVMNTNEAWAAKLRANRNIGDFRHWKDHNAYMKSLDRVIRDLTPKLNIT